MFKLQDINHELNKFNQSISLTNNEMSNLNSSIVEIDSLMRKQTSDMETNTESHINNQGYKHSHEDDLENILFKSDVAIKVGKY